MDRESITAAHTEECKYPSQYTKYPNFTQKGIKPPFIFIPDVKSNCESGNKINSSETRTEEVKEYQAKQSSDRKEVRAEFKRPGIRTDFTTPKSFEISSKPMEDIKCGKNLNKNESFQEATDFKISLHKTEQDEESCDV